MPLPGIQFENKTTYPVPTIYAIGRNYADHAKELKNPVPVGEPVVFLKAPSSIRSLTGGTMAFINETFHHEIELVIRVKDNFPLGAKLDWSAVDALALGLDLTRREAQAKLKSQGLPWTTAKSFAGSAVLSEFISNSDWRGQTHFKFSLQVNGELRQQGDTQNMIFDVPFILTWLAGFNQLQAGDLVFTGTPAGVGPIKQGEDFVMQLEEPRRQWRGRL